MRYSAKRIIEMAVKDFSKEIINNMPILDMYGYDDDSISLQISFSDVDGCIKIDYSFIVNNIEVDLTSDDLKDLNKTMSHYEDIELVALSKTVKIKIL